MTLPSILEKIKKWRCKKVCLTGGEPLLQKELPELVDTLLPLGYEISIETNGSIDISGMANRDVMIVMDMKCPSSGVHKKMRNENIMLLRSCDELKFVIGDTDDYRYAKEIIEKYEPICEAIMQPVWGKAKRLSEWILKDELNVRLSLQIHKILWGNRNGV